MPTVLIVDDHPTFRSTARQLLEAEGFDVVGEAEDGASALACVARLKPEVVLLDVQLPDMDGFEVTSRLTSNGNRTQVVLTSSRDASEFGALVAASGRAASSRRASWAETGRLAGVSTRAALGIWTLALACAAGAAVLVEASDHTSGKLGTLVLAIPTALAFIAGGILACSGRRTGPERCSSSLASPGPWRADDVRQRRRLHDRAARRHALHRASRTSCSRSERPVETRADRWIVYAFYAAAIVGPPLAFLFDDGELAGNPCAGTARARTTSSRLPRTRRSRTRSSSATRSSSLRLPQRCSCDSCSAGGGRLSALRRALFPSSSPQPS